MLKIKWRATAHWTATNRLLDGWTITGLSRYPTVEAAQAQINIWSGLFPFNTYYIELE